MRSLLICLGRFSTWRQKTQQQIQGNCVIEREIVFSYGYLEGDKTNENVKQGEITLSLKLLSLPNSFLRMITAIKHLQVH